MIIQFQRLHAPEPGDDGSGQTISSAVDPTPVADAVDNSIVPAPAPPAAAPAPTAAPVDPMAGLKEAIDAVGQPEGTVAKGPERGPDGKFVAKQGDTPIDPATPPTPTPAPVTPKAEDELTPPEGMTERAAARWQSLTERVKTIPQIEARATEATTALDSVRKLVNDSGLAANEFTDMLDMAKAFKSADPKDLQTALQQLDGLRADVARRLGVEVPGVDLLDKHPDLQHKVENMLLSRQDALEIANLRGRSAQAEVLTREQQEVQQHRTDVTKASQAMDVALQARANSPGHQEKLNAIGKYFADPARMKEFVTTYQPHQWSAAVGLMYDNINVQAPAAAPQGPQPLRASNVRSGVPVANGPMTPQGALEGAFAAIGM